MDRKRAGLNDAAPERNRGNIRKNSMNKHCHEMRRASLAALAISVAIGGFVATVPHSALAADWPQAQSDLPGDPAVLFGKLANGMRYAIMANATPKGAVAMRFAIEAGSMQESEAQQGLAHFLEHMAFRGSRHVPEDQVWSGLQRLGMTVGADANAGTGFTQTSYQFNLPLNDSETIDAGLLRLRDIASELTLAQRAMNDERGPILSEERLRDTPGWRSMKARLQQAFPGNIAMSRFPIGKTDVIKHAQIPLIRDFYDAYYRPENATLIVVGDIDPKVILAKITGRFSDWKPVGPAGVYKRQAPPGSRGPEAKLFVEPGAPSALALDWVLPRAPDSRARESADLVKLVGLKILDNRLQDLANGPQQPFAESQFHTEAMLPGSTLWAIDLAIQPQKWRTAVVAAVTTIRRMQEYGVTADEVARAKNEIRAALQAQAAKVGTRSSPEVADAILKSIDEGDVFASPVDMLSLAEDTFTDLTAEKVNAGLAALMRGHGPLLFLASPTPIEGGQAALTAALAATEKVPLAAAAAAVPVVWPYTSFGPVGQVIDRKTVADLQTTFVRFANGVKLTVKPTAFTTGDILVAVSVGNGRLGLPTDRASAVWTSKHGLLYGGLKAIGLDDMQRALAGKFLKIEMTLEDDGFVLSGQTRPADFTTQLQLLAAYVSAPGWRPGAIDRARGEEISKLTQLGASPMGVIQRDIGGLLHNDKRWATPSLAEVKTAGPNVLKDLLAPQLASAPIEVTVVGDIPVDAAVLAVAGTFGALPKRSEPVAPSSTATSIGFPAGTSAPIELHHNGRADQGVAVIGWPTVDEYDLQTLENLRVLEKVFASRLNDQLRVRDGATYSPYTMLGASKAFPGFGYFVALTELPSAKMPTFFNVSQSIAADLREHAISPDELERARKPAVETLATQRQTNEYWAYALRGAQTDGRRLDIIRNAIPDLTRVTAADVQRVAQTYLTDTKAWKAEITPQQKPAALH